jgi:hypothetical protein
VLHWIQALYGQEYLVGQLTTERGFSKYRQKAVDSQLSTNHLFRVLPLIENRKTKKGAKKGAGIHPEMKSLDNLINMRVYILRLNLF